MDEQRIALFSAGTSVLAAFVSGLPSLGGLRAQRLANRVQATAVRNQYFVELRRWADEACAVLSESVHLCDLASSKTADQDFFERIHRIRIQMSALIDRGRWFFPNRPVEGVGTTKQKAFQGYRHQILDCLVDGYRIIGLLDRQDQPAIIRSKEQLVNLKKTFVSQIQEVLDPRKTVEEFDRIMG